jgi:hypothetical protein
MLSPYPVAGILMGYCAVPTTYTGHAICRAAFGQNIQDIPNGDLGGGLILDAASAILLTERGIDVGLDPSSDLRSSFLKTTATRLLSGNGKERALLMNGGCKLLTAAIRREADLLLSCSSGKEIYPLCYRYENAKGQRFLVYLFEAMSLHKDSGLLQGYLVQDATTRGVEWISKEPLPAKCQGHPQLYMLCKRNGGKLTVGLFNCHADSIFEPTVTLDQSYQTLTCLNTSGRLTGNTVTLSELPAYAFAAFTVEE